jgi:hypothetical protein
MPGERRGEGADTAEPDLEADLPDRHLGRAEQVASAFQPATEEVLVGGLAEDTPEAAAEVAWRDVCFPSQNPQLERLAVAAVDQISGPQQVPL